MLKKLIFFILTCLSANLHSDISSNIGIQNNYINDKIHFRKNLYNEKIKNFNLYDLGVTYALFIDNFGMETKLDIGKGTSHEAFFDHIKSRAKEKVLNFGFNINYLFRIGPLSYGPKLGFDYNLQKIKAIHNNSLSVEWYLPNIGLLLKLHPIAAYPWDLYTYYDFGLGRVKAHSFSDYYFKHQALRNRFSIGSYQKIVKSLYCDIFFIYSHENKHYHKDAISRESFEGGLSLNYEF